MEKLSELQCKTLENHLQHFTYHYVKDIIAHVASTFRIDYSLPGMRNWLQRHGFSYKKPSIKPGKAKIEQQLIWLDEYENLKKRLQEDEVICFMDGVHPTHNIQPAYGWIKKGERKEIPANCGRSRLNLSGVIDASIHKVIIQEDKILNASSTINFLQKIEAAYSKKIKFIYFVIMHGITATKLLPSI